jgi:hypothetical protein
MSHDHIEFFPEDYIEVSKDGMSFALSERLHLHVQIFRLEDHDMEDQAEQHVLLLKSDHKIGEVWFDKHVPTQAQECVVLGKDAARGMKKARKYWYILLVAVVGANTYTRVGVGKIKPRYISKKSTRGVLA